MRTTLRARLSASILALFALSILPSTASAGPPWVSVELPANPHDKSTRGAYLLVHSFHHATELPQGVTGRAVGFVNGTRRVIPLEFTRTSRQGVMALRKSWPDRGDWVLAIATGEGRGQATALVAVRDGAVRSVEVPSRTDGEWVIPREVTDADIDGLLRQISADASPRGGAPLILVAGAVLLVPVVLFRRRRSE